MSAEIQSACIKSARQIQLQEAYSPTASINDYGARWMTTVKMTMR